MFAPQDAGGRVERQGMGSFSPWRTVHVARYQFALQFANARRVLDVACGTGYGLNHLAERARAVVGIDISLEAAISTGRLLAETPRALALIADGTSLPFESESFDLVVSFETLEHLEDRPRFVFELARVLAPGGRLVLSTPNANHTRPVDGKPSNPFHLHEYRPEELAAELESASFSVSLLGQALHPRFRVSPFWDEQERCVEAGERARVLLWRALCKLPRTLGTWAAQLAWGHPLVPEPEDYVFDAALVDDAPVLVAVCEKVL